jgi:hypothetical protein
MDDPKPRRETKKSPKDKKQSVYSTKHIRTVEALKEKRSK